MTGYLVRCMFTQSFTSKYKNRYYYLLTAGSTRMYETLQNTNDPKRKINTEKLVNRMLPDFIEGGRIKMPDDMPEAVLPRQRETADFGIMPNKDFPWILDPHEDMHGFEDLSLKWKYPGQQGYLNMSLKTAWLHSGSYISTLPRDLNHAFHTILSRYSDDDITALRKKAGKFSAYLMSRRRPKEVDEVRYIVDDFRRSQEYDGIFVKDLSAEEKVNYEEECEEYVMSELHSDPCYWIPLDYDNLDMMMYMTNTMPINYFFTFEVFAEIEARDPNFHPTSILDFGSGLGTSVWAVNSIWPHSIEQHTCVDTSPRMHKLARLLLQGGDEDNTALSYPGVHFQQHLLDISSTHDIVISAFSLLDLKNQQERLSLIWKLWANTKSYLVLIEYGSTDGYTALMEARSFILNMAQDESIQMDDEQRRSCEGHVFAPCQHDKVCPKLKKQMAFSSGDDDIERGHRMPCSFPIDCTAISRAVDAKRRPSHMSYVILKKGPRPESVKPRWPRILSKPQIKDEKDIPLVMCTPSGEIRKDVISQEHGPVFYRICRISKPKDLLPIVPSETSTLYKSDVEVQEDDRTSKNYYNKLYCRDEIVEHFKP